MGKAVLMTTPKPDAAERIRTSQCVNERASLERFLQLQPMPAMIADVAAGRAVLLNEPAHRVPLEAPAGAAGYYATDTSGHTIGGGPLVAHLAVRAQGPVGVEIAWHTPARRWTFRVLARSLEPRNGSPLLSLLTFLDITAQRDAEAELRHALAARDEFFSVATHELKDPLFSLQLSIQLLRHQTERLATVPAFLTHHLDVGCRQVDRLTRLVENLLEVSRIANRRLQLDPEALDLAELAREVTSRFQDMAAALRTPLILDCPEPVIGYYDRLKLERVLTNLLTNAMEYGLGQPIVLRVRGTPDLAVLEVEDHGMGIGPEDQKRIFERFERAAPGHRRESLGLGLHIVRALVEAHSGTVSLVSAVGVGSTFTVSLPRKRLTVPQAEDISGGPGEQS
jgi:signal transduction histidine kinase